MDGSNLLGISVQGDACRMHILRLHRSRLPWGVAGPSHCCFHCCRHCRQVVRKGGLRSTLLYNLLGPGEWDVLVMQVGDRSGSAGLGRGGVGG